MNGTESLVLRRYNLRNQLSSQNFYSELWNFESARYIIRKRRKKMKLKSNGFKKSHSSKSSLKRKISAIEAVIKADEDYEDDLYESMSFDHFKELLRDSTNTEEVLLISPAKLPTTPNIKCITPKFKDCLSPGEFEILRKASLEYIHRRRNRPTPPVLLVEKVTRKLKFSQVLENAKKFEESIASLKNNQSDEEDDDDGQEGSFH